MAIHACAVLHMNDIVLDLLSIGGEVLAEEVDSDHLGEVGGVNTHLKLKKFFLKLQCSVGKK